jgi:hypothetical protein
MHAIWLAYDLSSLKVILFQNWSLNCAFFYLATWSCATPTLFQKQRNVFKWAGLALEFVPSIFLSI